MAKRVILLLIFITLVVGLFGWLNLIELRAEEPRRAIVSIEMLLSGDYTHLQISGEHYYNKPPVFNIILTYVYKLFGSFSEWVVRLPSLICFLISGVVIYLFGKRYLDKEIALYATLFYFTAGDLLFYGTVNSGEIDLLYSLLIIVQAIVIFYYQQKGNYFLLFLFSYTLTAIGLLTKGLSSLPFQAFTVLGWFIYTRNFKKIFSWQHLVGISVLAGITVGYFMLYDIGGDARGYIVNLVNESTHKTAQQQPLSKTIVSFLVFPFNFIKLLMPWALLMVFMFTKQFKATIKAKPALAFSAIFIVSNIWLYWLSPGTANRYLYMFFPFLFYIIMAFYTRYAPEMPKRKKVIEGIFMGLIVLVCIAFIAMPFIPALNSVNHLTVISIILALTGFSILYFYYRLKTHRILLLVLFMCFMRIATNLTFLPASQATSSSLIYRDAINDMLAITKNEPIYFYGEPYKYHVQAKLGGIVFDEVDMTVPPFMPYQIFYYISAGNKQICQFTTKLEKGKYYVSREIWVPQDVSISVLSSFTEATHQQKIILFTLN